MTREVEQTMQIAVCDDEKNVRELLADKIRSLFPSAELALYPSGEELLAADSGGYTDRYSAAGHSDAGQGRNADC